MIGLIGAMEEEVEILRSEMTDLRVEKCKKAPAFEFLTGQLEGKDVVLLKSGIGKVQAAAGAVLLIDKYSPSLVLNTGCAGGINPKGAAPLNFGDLVVSSSLVYHDFDITAFGYERGQVPGQKSAFFAVDSKLSDTAILCAEELKSEKKLPASFKALAGVICSGDIFMSDSQRVLELSAIFAGVRAVEMEGAAIAHVCTLFGVPFLVLRCLSDIAGEESPVTFDKFLPVAAENSSRIVRRFLKKI